MDDDLADEEFNEKESEEGKRICVISTAMKSCAQEFKN